MNDKNIIYGGDFPVDLGHNSFGEFVLRNIVKNGSKKPFIDGLTGKFLTKSEFVRLNLQNTYVLNELELKYGDIISICSENRLEYMSPLIAGLCSGITTAPLNPVYTPAELTHCLNLTKPKVVFCSKFTIKPLLIAIKNCNFVQKIVCFDDVKIDSPIVINYTDLLKSTSKYNCDINTFKFPKLDISETIALILYSSGTTGLPKGVILTHSNILIFAQIYRHPDIRNFDENEIVVSILPFFHAFGCIGILQGMTMGLTVVLLVKFDLEKYLQLIEKYRATVCVVVPPIFVLFAKSPLLDNYDLSSVKMLACGAAPLSADLQKAVCKRFKITHTRQGYGMTETTLAVTVHKHNTGKTASAGILVPTTYAKVVDLKTGVSLGPNQEGELCFKGGIITKGYYKDPKATAETIDSDGWIHTGDIGYYDEDHYFYIVDRLKELIKCSGFQVAPAELEAVLLENKQIKDVGVVGIPNERHGEVPLAFVVRQPNSKITEQEIKDFIAARLSPHKHLRGGVIFVEEIPKNPSGKILRRSLRELVNKLKPKL